MNFVAIDFNVAGIEFIIGVLLAAAIFFHLPTPLLRQSLWAAANVLVLWLVVPNTASWVALAVFLGSGYLMVRMLRMCPSGRLLASYLALLVVAFLVLKQYAILDWVLPRNLLDTLTRFLGGSLQDGVLRHAVRILGLSYMLFRQIHVLVDASQGQIERISLWSFVNYQVSLFTIQAGPIQRYQDFEEQWRTLQPVLSDRYGLLQNCLRLLWGVMKIGLIAPLFYQGWDEVLPSLVNMRVAGWKYVAEFPVVFYFYPIYLYCNFSGYCDIVIAANRFLGMRLPENFNYPWLARNVLDFWNRWHITLGLWIRDYLFMPMYKPVVEHWPKRAAGLAWIFYLLAFIVAGAWHGTTVNFLVYGGLQGLGASLAKIWENRIIAIRGRNGLKQYMQSGHIRFVAIVLNLHFQCFSLLFFSQTNCEDSWALLRGLIGVLTGHRV
jgi:alginate O-acetyltransferase complex protein AlgI